MNSTTTTGRWTAQYDDPVTVFLIGLRINRWRRVDKWLPAVRAMGPMVAELSERADSGFLGAETLLGSLRTVAMVQYWRDFDSLEAYARDRQQHHWPAWTRFNKAIGRSGAVGIFHETYVVPADQHETIYVNMPPFGLGKVKGLVPAGGSRETARLRLANRASGE